MEVKLIEIRDRATFIPAIAIRLAVPELDDLNPLLSKGILASEPDARKEYIAGVMKYHRERYLLRRAGYGEEQIQPEALQPMVLLTRLEGDSLCGYDPYNWPNRTWTVVHQWLIEHWREFESGNVVDVEFILGETKEPKQSEATGLETCKIIEG